MKYFGKLTGKFEVTQHVEADSLEEATKLFGENRGDNIEVIAVGDLEVTDVAEVE